MKSVSKLVWPKGIRTNIRAIGLDEPVAQEMEVKTGVMHLYVGELVREGVENDWPHIFTDLEFEPIVEARFAAIKQGFDHIRGRDPKR